MAIDWTTGTSALFKKLGRIARIVEIYDAFETDIDGDLNGLVTTTWTEDMDYYSQACSSILQLKDNMKNQLSTMREEISSVVPFIVQGELTANDSSPTLSTPDMMDRLLYKMLVANVGVTQAGITNQVTVAGTGYTGTLHNDEDYSSGYASRSMKHNHVKFTALDTETVDLTTRYREKIKVSNLGATYTRPGGQDWGKRFNPVTLELLVSDSTRNRVKNGSFEKFDRDNVTATDWVLSSGAWGTDCSSSTTSYYLNSRSLEIDGGGSGSIVLKQPIAAGTLKPRTMYAYSIRVRTDDSGGTTEYELNMSLGTGNPFITLASITSDSWATYTGFFISQDVISPLEWVIDIGLLASTGNLYVDEIVVVEVSRYAGVPIILVPTTTQAVMGERVTSSVTIGTGKFASFFGRFFNVHLPNHSGGTAINDSLVA